MARIDLIYFDAGGGHRAAATALEIAIRERQPLWDTRLVHLQELLDPIDVFRKFGGVRLQDVYNSFLKKGWTLGSPQLLRVLQAVIRAFHAREVSVIEQYWRARAPDMVVSLVPHFNRALGESLRHVCPRTPFVTVLTDLADYPPHFWIERQEQFLICGSHKAVEQAKALGHPEHRIFRTSGMILHPRFYRTAPVNRAAERARLGLDPDRPTALVLFGGEGSKAMLEILRRLDRSGLEVQLILICGNNAKLERRLREYPGSILKFVEGFTTEIPYYMQLADFLIGKPGPGSMSEALIMKLPVIVACNSWTLPQERYNAEWLLQTKAGLVVRSFRQIDDAVSRLIEPSTFARYRASAAAFENQAVFEIPGILERILGRA